VMTRINFGNLLFSNINNKLQLFSIISCRLAVVINDYDVVSDSTVVQDPHQITEQSRNSASKLAKHKCASIPMGL
jgi:hypothetical protein